MMKKLVYLICLATVVGLLVVGCGFAHSGGEQEDGIDIVDQTAPKVEFSKSKFEITASITTIDLREWVSPVPANYKLPNINFDISGIVNPSGNLTSVAGNILTPGASTPDNETWTIKATVGGNTATATLKIVDRNPFTDQSDAGITPESLKGKTYVTQNRVGNATSPWYAIHFFDDGNHLGIGRCSIVQGNAIKLARQGSGSTGASSGHKVEYEYNSGTKVFTMKSSVGIIGGDFVINGETLKNSFLVDTVEFKLVK